MYTEPNFYFNTNGDMCKINENGEEEIIAPASELFDLNMINGIMAQSDANNDLV